MSVLFTNRRTHALADLATDESHVYMPESRTHSTVNSHSISIKSVRDYFSSCLFFGFFVLLRAGSKFLASACVKIVNKTLTTIFLSTKFGTKKMSTLQYIKTNSI